MTATPGIFRGALSFEQGFTRIPNRWLRDPRIGFRAKGLLGYLLSHEIGYTITLGQIERETGDGRHAIRSAMDELISAGYLSKQRTYDERGWNAGLAWFLSDPHPKSENPTLENPTLENRPTLEENLKEKTKIRELYAQDELERAFNEFWQAYPRREGKAAAKKAFVKAVEQVTPDEIVAGARRFGTDPNLPAKQYIPHPATWLNAGRWDDEPLPERELTPEEKAERARKRAEQDHQRVLEQQEKRRIENERIQAELQANPPQLCEHDRVKVMCKFCSPINVRGRQ